MPPIFQPEVPAEAVYWAAHHRRRELWVGHSTVKAILASYLAPSLADRYLARTGYDSQQMPDAAGARRTVPPTSSARCRGRPRRTAASTTGRPSRSPQLWLTMHRGALLAGAASALAAGRRALGGDEPRPAWLNTPHTLREYALLADGERGAIVGPRGDLVWMCFPHWDSDAALLGADRRRRHLRRDARPSGTCGAATTSRAA